MSQGSSVAASASPCCQRLRTALSLSSPGVESAMIWKLVSLWACRVFLMQEGDLESWGRVGTANKLAPCCQTAGCTTSPLFDLNTTSPPPRLQSSCQFHSTQPVRVPCSVVSPLPLPRLLGPRHQLQQGTNAFCRLHCTRIKYTLPAAGAIA